VPVLVGGTGVLPAGLLDPMFSEPEADAGRRRALRTFLNGLSLERLRAFLAALDPAREALGPRGRTPAHDPCGGGGAADRAPPLLVAW